MISSSGITPKQRANLTILLIKMESAARKKKLDGKPNSHKGLVFDKANSEDGIPPSSDGESDPTKQYQRKIRDDKAATDLIAAPQKLVKGGDGLAAGCIDPERIEAAVEVIKMFAKQQVFKFSDMMEDAYDLIGEALMDMYSELKLAYNYYYNNTTDEEAVLMDGNIRSIKFEDIIKSEENVSDRPGNQQGHSGNTEDAAS